MIKQILFFIFSLLLIKPYQGFSQLGIITTIAGTGLGGNTGDSGLAIYARIGNPGGMVFDKYGNLYICTGGGHKVRKIDTNGIITSFAGTGIAGFSGDGFAAYTAQFISPIYIAVNSKGNLFISDQSNHRIRKVDTFGNITTIAGNGTTGFNGDNIQSSSAQLSTPEGLSFDKNDNLFFADFNNNRIRKIDTFGIITTVAGTGAPGFSGDSNLAINAMLHQPINVVSDSNGNNIYISDFYNLRVRKVDFSTGIITTIAGNGLSSYNGDSIMAIAAQLNGVYDIKIDNSNNNLFITDRSHQRIRRINISSGIITNVAGNGTIGFSGDNGTATNAQIYAPEAITFDQCGNLLIGDLANYRIRKVWYNTDTIPQVNIAVTPNDTVVTGALVTTNATVPTGTITNYQWVKNGANASTNSAYTYTPTNGDSVYCIVTVRACTGRMYTDTTTAIHLTVTGDAGVANTTNYTTHTYPNPVIDVLHVATTETQHFVLHNLMGITLLQGSVDKQNTIDMKAVPTGIYLLQLTNIQGQREVVRVVKE
jgi:sugar lactone lactonase YvrE